MDYRKKLLTDPQGAAGDEGVTLTPGQCEHLQKTDRAWLEEWAEKMDEHTGTGKRWFW